VPVQGRRQLKADLQINKPDRLLSGLLLYLGALAVVKATMTAIPQTVLRHSRRRWSSARQTTFPRSLPIAPPIALAPG
jgi:hypothetical protein